MEEFYRLYQAVQRGWADYEHTRQDEDLQSLRGTEAWLVFLFYFRRALNSDSSDN